MLRKLSSLKGFKVEGKGEELGKIEDFYFDEDYFTLRYLLIDTGSWLKDEKTLISTDALEEIDYQSKKLKVNLNTETLKEGPSLEKNKPISQIMEEKLTEHFNWPVYWIAPTSNISRIAKENKRKEEISSFNNQAEEENDMSDRKKESNLRSFDEIKGYYLKTDDKEFGHLKDLFVDEENWLIRYLLIDTCNFLPCKDVLIAPEWIIDISWNQRNIHVNKTKKEIKKAPAYKEEKSELSVNRDYEKNLYDHYNEKGYWWH